MTNYNLEDFQSWLNEARNQELKRISAVSWEGYINTWKASATFDQVCQEFRNRPPHKAKHKAATLVLQWMDEVNQRQSDMKEQLKSLLNQLKSNQTKWVVISQNQALIRDAVEKFMLDESSLTSQHSNFQFYNRSEAIHLMEQQLNELEEQKRDDLPIENIDQRIAETKRRLQSFKEIEKQQQGSWATQIAQHKKNVDQCQAVLAKLPSTSEPVPAEVLEQDSEFFTNLLTVLETICHRLAKSEQLEQELEEIKTEKEELETKQSWVDKLKYGTFQLGDDLGKFDFSKERAELRKEYLSENGTN